jgi:hypothetical protein
VKYPERPRLAVFKTYKIPRPHLVPFDEDSQKRTGKTQRIGWPEKFADPIQKEQFDTLQKRSRSGDGRKIYAEVLGVEHVGATDNFFALGGMIRYAPTQVIARIRASLT